MDESEGNIKTEDVNNVDSPTFVKTKPKKRSLVERELETNLTARVTSPATSEGSSTSRYGRARKLKTATELDAEKMASQIMKPLKIDVSKQPQAYKMHASNSPVSKEYPKRTISASSSIEDQIENIYSENISLSRFGSEEKSKSPAKKFSKVYMRKDLIQKPDTDTVVLIKNMFSPNKSSSHLNNILERSSEKYSLNGHGKVFSFPDSSVVKTLDFDGKKKTKAVTSVQPKVVTIAQPKQVTTDQPKLVTIAQPKLVTAVQPIKKEFKDKMVSKNELFELEAACEYQLGDLAWGRVGTYPYWPCIVTREPFSDMFVKKKLFGRVERSVIHVTFFGDNGRRGWIVDNMLRKYHGRAEFVACRDKFTAESKKKDPRLYAAHFVSEKKLPLWNISVEEAETLMKEPKRLRIDALYDMLEKARAAKNTPSKREKSGKICRTDSDVSLSESLYDTLFSEDDGKTDDNNRLKKARNKSLDVSEVVTACLDNMAAKSGIIQIQRQSHMDRWLQKAKSKTPEKMQPKLHIRAERERRKDAKKKEGKKQKARKNESIGSDANLLPYQNEHDYSSVNYENHDINDSNKNTDSASGLDSTLDTTLGTSSSDIGVTVKIENISSSMEDCSQDDIITTVVNDDIVMTDPENISRDNDSQNETLAHGSKESQNNNEDLVTIIKDNNELVAIKEEFPLKSSDMTNIIQPRRSKRKRQTFEGLNNSFTENKAKEPKLDFSGQTIVVTKTADDIPESNKHQESTVVSKKDSEKTVTEGKLQTIKSSEKETSRNDKVESMELDILNSSDRTAVLIGSNNSKNAATVSKTPTVEKIETRKSKRNKQESIELTSSLNKSEPVIVNEPITSETSSINGAKEPELDSRGQESNFDVTNPDDVPEIYKKQDNTLKLENDSEKTATDTEVPTVKSTGNETSLNDKLAPMELVAINSNNDPAGLIKQNNSENMIAATGAPTVAKIEKQKSRKSKRKSTQSTSSDNKSEAVVVIKPIASETATVKNAKEPKSDTTAPDDTPGSNKNQDITSGTEKGSEKTATDTKLSTMPNVGKEASRNDQVDPVELTSNSHNKPADLIDNFENTTTSSSAPIVANIEKQKPRKTKRKSTQNTSSDNKSEAIVVIETITTETTLLEIPKEPKSDLSGKNVETTTPDDAPTSSDNQENTLETGKHSGKTATDTKASTMPSIGKETCRSDQIDSMELTSNSNNKLADPVDNFDNTTLSSSAPTVANIETQKLRKSKRKSTQNTSSDNKSEPIVVIETITPKTTLLEISKKPKSDLSRQNVETTTPDDAPTSSVNQENTLETEKHLEKTATDTKVSTMPSIEKETSRSDQNYSMELTSNSNNKPADLIDNFGNTTISNSAPTVANIEKQKLRKSKQKSTHNTSSDNKSEPIVLIETITTETALLKKDKDLSLSFFKSDTTTPEDTPESNKNQENPLEPEKTTTDTKVSTRPSIEKETSRDKLQSRELDKLNSNNKPIDVVEQHNSETTTTASTPTVVNIEKRKSRRKTRESTELMPSNNKSEVIEPSTSENTQKYINTRSRREKSQYQNHEEKHTPCDNDVKTLAVKEPLNSENNLEITASTAANVEKQINKKSKRKSTELSAMNSKSRPVVVIEKINSKNTLDSNEPSIKNLENESQNDKFGPMEITTFNIKSKPVVVIEQMNSENTLTGISAPVVTNVRKATSSHESIELMPFNSNYKPVVIIEPLDMKGLETQLIIKGSKQIIKNKTLDSLKSDSVENSEAPIADVGQKDVCDSLQDNNTIKECTVHGSLEKVSDKANSGETPSQFHDVSKDEKKDCHQKSDEDLINSEIIKKGDCLTSSIEDYQAKTTLAEIFKTDLNVIVPIETESGKIEVDECASSDGQEKEANTNLTPQLKISENNTDFSVAIETKPTEAPKQHLVNNYNEIPTNNIATNVVIGEETYIFDRTLSQDYDEIDGDNYDEYSHLPPVIFTKEADAYLINSKSNIQEETVPHNSNVANDLKCTEKVSTSDDDLTSKDSSGVCIFSEKVNSQTNTELATLDDNKASLISSDVSNMINDEKNEASNQVTEENNEKCVFLDQSSTTADAQFADVVEKKKKSLRFKLNRKRFHLLKLNKAEKIDQPSDNIIETVNTDPRTSVLETSPILTNGYNMSINIDTGSLEETQKSKKSKNDLEFIKYLELRQDALLDEQPDLSQDEIVTYLYKNWLYEEGNKSDMKKIDDSAQSNLVKGFSQELPQPKKVKEKHKIIRIPKKNNVDIRDMLQKEKTKSVLDELPSESLKNSPEHDFAPDISSNQVQTSQENILQTIESSCENENTILEKPVCDTSEKSSSLNNSQISSIFERANEKEDTDKKLDDINKELKEKTDDKFGPEAASITSKHSKLSITRRSRRSKEKRDPIKTDIAEPKNCVLKTDPVSINESELAVTDTERPKENIKKVKNEPEFIKFLEMHQDTLLDEQPDLTQDEIVTYLYQNWQYEESNKSEMKKLDDNEQSYLVKGFNQEIPQPKKIRKKSKVDKNEDIRNMLYKQNLKDVTEKEASGESILNGTQQYIEFEVSQSIIGDPKLLSTEESNNIKEHITLDQVKDSDDNVQNLTEVKEEQKLNDKSPEFSNIKSEIFEIEDIEFDIDELSNTSVSKESAHSKIINGFIEFEENARKSEANEVFDPKIASVKPEESGVSITTRKGRKEKDAKSMDDPDFIKYLESRQDALIEEQPDLTQEEIVTYLYQTWFYEESTKSDVKKSDDTEQSNLVKGLNPEPVPQPIRIKKKPKVEKDATEKVLKNKDTKAKPEKALKNADIRDMIQKPKRKATQSKPYYNEDDSDLEEEDLETFKIFDRDEQNEDGEVIDEVELYFEQLTKPKPNVFKGYVRERVCEICYRASNLVKCKSCHGTFHVECVKKEVECTEATGPSRGRKKKRGRKPKGYDPSLDSQSDDRSQDANNSEELNISIEEETESHIVIDETNFETLWENKMKELQSENQEEYISDQEIDWEVEPGLCQIVDLKQKEKPVDYSDYKCNNCLKYDTPVCFVCKSNKSPKDTEIRQKCHVAHCHRYYHLECLEYWPQTQFNSWEPSKNKKQIEYIEALSCPRHVCHTCVSDDPRGCKTRFCGDKLARCVKCPATYHSYTKCLPAGSQILTGSQIICPRHYEHRPGKVPCHVNTGWCFICALGGTLICCEYCPTSFHAECLNIDPPEGSYMCEDCETGRLPLYGEMVWVKLGHYRWWPGIVLHPTEIPDNILAVKHSPGEFVVRFFGQYDHYWVNRGRVFPFQEGDSGKISSQKSKIDAAFTTAMEHAQRACEILKNMEPNEEEDLDIASSLLPPHYVKLKVNKPVGTVVRRDVDANSLTQCDCDPNQADPCGPYTHCLNRMLLTECGPLCRAGERCNNRAFEKRLYPRLQAYRTPHRGWGLRTLEQIRQGQFVIEYVGELIDMEEFRRRMCRKHEIRDENFYFLTLDKERMIDAGPKGNLARFMNHCCEPNCETQKWTVLGDVRVGLFALRDIPANSEVTFNYNLECAGIEKKRCLCGANRCSGYIGAKPKQLQEEKTNKSKPATKRTYKKRKPVEEPTTSKPKIPKIKIKPIKPKELTEIEKDLLIIKNATNGMSSDSDGSRLSVEDKIPRALKRKRVSFSTDDISGKKAKMADGVMSEATDAV